MKITIEVEDLAVLSYLSGVTEQVEIGEGSEKVSENLPGYIDWKARYDHMAEQAENWEASYLAEVAYQATLEEQIRELKAEVIKYKNLAEFLN